MIETNDLITWFNNLFNNCYYVKHDDHPDSIFMFYDLRYVRKIKLSQITGKPITQPKNITGVCLFEQDWKNNYLWCKYNEIWKYLEDNYSSKYNDIQSFIKDRLEEHTKMNVLTPKDSGDYNLQVLEEHTKMNVLTPWIGNVTIQISLEEHTKMNVLTPDLHIYAQAAKLEEHTKMNVLTPSFGVLHPSIGWKNIPNLRCKTITYKKQKTIK